MLLSIAKQPKQAWDSLQYKKGLKLRLEPAHGYWKSLWQKNGVNITNTK